MSKSRLGFRVEATVSGSRARASRFQTLHSEVLAPLFMPVGTQATVKAQMPHSLEDAGSQILLANTYHLLLRPGPEVFDALGGYHGFTSWSRSVLTDSGGFQIFSLKDARTISEEGASFKSYIDGTRILLSPEKSIATQKSIGSDIMMVLDQCIPSTADRAQAEAALGLTHRWAKRSLPARGDSPQSLFAIVQGALYPDLRRKSADQLTSLPFDGYAIGGLAVGEGKEEREATCELTTELLPLDRPRYLMGVGTPLDILEGVHRGVDMFDCIIPTQVAQHGTAFTSRGLIKTRRSVHRFSEEALDPACHCPTCQRFSRAYLYHLGRAKEPLAWQLLGQHNIYFYHQLMREIRQSILEDRFMELYGDKREILHEPDIDNPVLTAPPKRKAAKKGPQSLGHYEVHRHETGFASIRHTSSGEIMHSHNPPLKEAEELYVQQSKLREALLASTNEPFVVWDVGLGAAANALAAIRCHEALRADGEQCRPLHLVSFENDLDSLRLALANHQDFPYLWHGGPPALVADGHWRCKSSQQVQWTLLKGEFLECLSDAPSPDLIYFDMFSAKTSGEQWTLPAFETIWQACESSSTQLFTYSRSTRVRACLLAAGFYVASGNPTGAKAETTIAMTARAAAAEGRQHALLGDSWITRWQRSAAQYPGHFTSDEREAFAARVLGHPQFRD
ncbi:MAG: tRNA guanosine(34) transglycosylase Tgt [Myxococcales bacterium]|nr:tRNA guanosine(34) transglycosylase Tgt [Myxococcales bacterium]